MPASRAYSSSSGGAACPGATRGHPRRSTPGVRGWFQGDLSEKTFLWRTSDRHWTDRRDSGNSEVDVRLSISPSFCLCLFVHPSICLVSVCQSVFLSVCLYIYLSVHPSIHSFFCLSVHLSVRLHFDCNCRTVESHLMSGAFMFYESPGSGVYNTHNNRDFFQT